MKEILELLFKTSNFKQYSEDYSCKIRNIPIYHELNKKYLQLELADFINYFKSNNLEEYINQKINEIKTEYLYSSETHGLYHNIRVMLFALYIATKEKFSPKDTELVINAALYHDTGRVNDEEDDSHGLRSANLIETILGADYPDIIYLKAIMEQHSIDDENAKSIIEKYQLSDVDKYNRLYKVLKDADALDRVRLSFLKENYSSLNPLMLRFPTSNEILKVAHDLHEFFLKN